MPALPTPGSDNNVWGTELNNFLLVSLNADGTIKTPLAQPFSIPGAATVGNGLGRLPFFGTTTILGVRATANTAPVGSSLIFDVNKNGSTIFTTVPNRPTIAASANASSLAVPDITSLVGGDYLTVNIAQIGATTPGSDIVVVVYYH